MDPVTVNSAGGNFNRYWYANNNPYRFTDPDGRQACSAACMDMREQSDRVGSGLKGWSGTATEAFFARLNERSRQISHTSNTDAAVFFGAVALPLQKKLKVEIGANLAEFGIGDFRVVDFHAGAKPGSVGVLPFNSDYHGGGAWRGILHTHPVNNSFSGLGQNSRFIITNAEGDVTMSNAYRVDNYLVRPDYRILRFNYGDWINDASSQKSGKILAESYVEGL